jgi:hypothetical protein
MSKRVRAAAVMALATGSGAFNLGDKIPAINMQ